jgi:hypothetical protein
MMFDFKYPWKKINKYLLKKILKNIFIHLKLNDLINYIILISLLHHKKNFEVKNKIKIFFVN